MERLTTNKEVFEMSMVELAYNSCYAKENKARYRNYDMDIDARELAIRLLEKVDIPNEFTCDEDFDDFMLDASQYGTDKMLGLIALFYRNLWAMADLRERLKKYEDTNLSPEQILEMDKLYQELSKEVMKYRKAAESNGWIPCSNGKNLPKEAEHNKKSGWSAEVRPTDYVLCKSIDGNIFKGFYSYVFKIWTDFKENCDYKTDEIIAWQPLPEQYKGSETTETEQKNSAPDKDADVTDIVINYSNGTQEVVQKGCICEMKLNEDDTCTMDFTMVNVSGKELEHIVMGFLHLGEEMGLFDNEGDAED